MFAKSFETITKPLRKMIQDLRQHAEDKYAEASAHNEEASRRVKLHDSCLDESDKAMETAQNIANLIGEPAEGE